jgi:hypothetical protein
MQPVEDYLKTAVAERRMMDRKIREDATEKRRKTHINAITNIKISDRNEGLQASERMSEVRGYVESLTK